MNDVEHYDNINDVEHYDNINDVESFINMSSDKYDLIHDDSPSEFSINNITPMVDVQEGNKTNCNIINSNIINDYKKKYFSMYAHQAECNKTKDCNQSTDANSMNFYTLTMNQNKSCATCTKDQPILDRPTYNKLSKEVQDMDNDIIKQKKIRDGNVSNFVNFENNVYQNSVGETSVDKMAEIRTNIGTCGLNNYGTTIAQVYDNLLSTVAGETLYNGNQDPSTITGVLEDSSYSSNFESL